MKVTLTHEPTVWITPLAKHKMDLYTELSGDEVGWLGRAVKLPNGDYAILDTFLFEQEVHSTTCEITPEGLQKVAVELMQTEEGREALGQLKVWGHSHVNMGVTPSGQDEDQLNVFKDGNGWFIRIITNKSGAIGLTIIDWERGVKIEDVPYKVYFDFNIREEVEKELKEKVTKKTYTYKSVTKSPNGWGDVYGLPASYYEDDGTDDKDWFKPNTTDEYDEYINTPDDALMHFTEDTLRELANRYYENASMFTEDEARDLVLDSMRWHAEFRSYFLYEMENILECALSLFN